MQVKYFTNYKKLYKYKILQIDKVYLFPMQVYFFKILLKLHYNILNFWELKLPNLAEASQQFGRCKTRDKNCLSEYWHFLQEMKLRKSKTQASLQYGEVDKTEVLIKMFEDCHPSKNNALLKSPLFNIYKPKANEKFY